MDDPLDTGQENAHFALAQEYTELLHILSTQRPTVIVDLCQTIPAEDTWQVTRSDPASSPATVAKALLDYYSKVDSAQCRDFLQSICMLCENIPMWLETRLMSVSGNPTRVCDISSLRVTETPLLSLEEQQIKRPRLDYLEQYIASVKSLLRMRWEKVRKNLVIDVQPDNVWISLRTANRIRDRPDQTPGPVDRGSRTPESDAEYESKVTLDTFLQDSRGKVTVLYGLPGSGKTMLMSCLGQLWARDLGPAPTSHLFVLLEFRHLNFISHNLSLSELLFQHYLPPEGREEQEAIVDHLLSNPEQSYWVLDGYDEFKYKLIKYSNSALLDPRKPLTVAELISGLLNRHILPGCTVVVTCRVHNTTALDGIADKVGQLQHWSLREIKEYVDNYFKLKAVGKQAADLLLSSRHLVTMSTIPALCNICCICLDYLLLGAREGDREIAEGAKQCRDDLHPVPQIPSTSTQIYLTSVGAFLSHCPDKGDSQSTVFSLTTLVSQHKSELCELCELAWNGLQSGQILFLEEDIPNSVLGFSLRTGFLSKIELRQDNGILVSAYSFIHLTVQEFFSALKIMTSSDITDTQLKKRFSLKTCWTTKSDQRTVFTDSLYLYVCGLTSPHCTAVLALLAKARGNWVQKRQEIVIKLLQQLCQSTLTGPKVLELCHCVQESQNVQLAKELMHTTPVLELRKIWLSPNDIDALAFVVNSSEDQNIGLDFRACSMELECLEFLPRCRTIHYLSFHGRKYGDKFAEKLSTILSKFSFLAKLNFCGGSLTATGAAHLASALLDCPCITEINLSDNNLKDEGVKHITDVLSKLQQLLSVQLGQNNTSVKAVVYLIKEISSLNLKHIHIDGVKELTVTFYPNSDRNSHKVLSEAAVSLLNQNWNKSVMQNLAMSLTQGPPVSVLNLSGGNWKLDSLKVLVQFLPKFNITEKIIMDGSCSSVEALVVLTALMSDCTAVTELQIRLKSSGQVSIFFCGGKVSQERGKSLSLSCCGLVPASLERVLRSLGRSSDLTILDLSTNLLQNEGLKKLLNGLPQLREICQINASNNGITMDGVILLAGALCSHKNLIQVHTSHDGKEKVILKFCPNQSVGELKIFRLNNSSPMPDDVTSLCKKLLQCHSFLEFDLSHSSLNDETIKDLVKVLPKMTSLQTLSLGHCVMSTTGAVLLARCFIGCERVRSVELSSQRESFVIFDKEKQDQFSCRFSHFNLNGSNLRSLLEILQHGPVLSELDLSSNHMGEEGVEHFADSLPGLRVTNYINLSNNGLTQQSLLELTEKLCTCDSVSAVDVCFEEEQRCLIWFRQCDELEKTLRVTGGSLNCNNQVQLVEILSNCPSQIKLQFKNCFPESVENFVKMLNSGQKGCTVSIEESWIRSEEAVSLLCHCLELNSNINTIRIQQRTLHMYVNKCGDLASDSGDTAGPSSTSTAQKIGLVDCGIQGYQLVPMRNTLQSCLFLTELDLSHNSLGEVGAEFLCSVLPSLPKLNSLSVGSKNRCETFAERLSMALPQTKAIQYLNLSGHVISEMTAQMMTSVLPSLRSLNLSHCAWLKSGGLHLIRSLAHCEHLEELWLNCVHLDEDCKMCLARSVSSIKTLRILKLGKIYTHSLWSDVLVAMENLIHVKELEIDSWRIADKGVELLVRLLPLWNDLQKISVSKNLISDQSGEKLMEALKSCTRLRELQISSNSLGDLTAARMALVFPALTHLCVVDISENSIGHEGSVCLAKAISFLKNLTKINLTSVGTSELCAVIASLENCPQIQDVSLGWNNCADGVALELARVLPLCQRMIKIDLECNIVSVSGAEALIKALQSCPAMEIIRLWKNRVSSDEAEGLRLKDRRLSFSST